MPSSAHREASDLQNTLKIPLVLYVANYKYLKMVQYSSLLRPISFRPISLNLRSFHPLFFIMFLLVAAQG